MPSYSNHCMGLKTTPTCDSWFIVLILSLSCVSNGRLIKGSRLMLGVGSKGCLHVN